VQDEAACSSALVSARELSGTPFRETENTLRLLNGPRMLPIWEGRPAERRSLREKAEEMDKSITSCVPLIRVVLKSMELH